MNGVTVTFVDHDWDRYREIAHLCSAVLYEPFGLAWEHDLADAPWLTPEPGSVIAVALTPSGELVGTARLLPSAGDTERQVRQVAVADTVRGAGVGRALMVALEVRAQDQGAVELWLNARDSAYGFYAALGYELLGEEFVSELTGIPHRL
ncbi:MAG: GNAT family N-acetyltransferase, partial [Coriobacteriia bacterium]|nr:GNAT family N-acetyltransferase [Coriobacteriia bacterium]